MKKDRRLLTRLTESADLAGEPLPGVPLVEIAGTNRVLIENHLGVCEYGRERIQVHTCDGLICVCGENLELVRMTKAQLVIAGRIRNVSVLGRD